MGKVYGRPEPAGPDIVGRGAWGETESKGANHLSQVPEGGWTLPLSASRRRPDRGKTSCNEVKKAIFAETCYVGHNGATLVSEYG